MVLPKKITPCPVIDALVEIRFIPNTHPNAVFGLIYSALQNSFPNVENLPILQIPEPLRNIDPNLKYKPHYKISNTEYVVQIGSDVISISSYPNYSSWSSFYNKIIDVLNSIEKSSVIKTVLRVGIRYINFFENDIYNKINLNISINNSTIDYKSTVFRTEIIKSDFVNTLQVANNINNMDRIGSLIDIDTSTMTNLDKFFTEKDKILNKGHQYEKEIFFSLLKNDFLNSLNPEY